jgi:hypothetical protein
VPASGQSSENEIGSVSGVVGADSDPPDPPDPQPDISPTIRIIKAPATALGMRKCVDLIKPSSI